MENISVCNLVQDFLNKNDLKYRYDEEENKIFVGFNISGKIRNVKILVDFNYDDCYVVICPLSINAAEESYPDLLRLLNYINFTSRFGNFEMDEYDGEVRYRMSVDCEGQLPSSGMVKKSIFIPLKMIQDYGEKLIDIMMGYKTFDTIKEELSKKNN